jgi:hypothetical protein
MTPHNDILSEAAQFASDKTFIDTRSLYEAAIAAPDKYPTISYYYTQYTVRGAKRLITHTLLSSGKWERYNAGNSHGMWAILTRVKPVEHTLLAEIERIRGAQSGISTGTLWEHAGKNEYPFLSALEDEGETRFKTVVAKTLRQAGYVRRSAKSTYFFAPGATE